MKSLRRLSENIARYEVACNCGCGFDSMDSETISVVQGLIDLIAVRTGKSIKILITSGCRCRTHNTNEDGSKDSQHLKSRALDFKLFYRDSGVQVSTHQIYQILTALYPGIYGIGVYKTFNHLDTRSTSPWRGNYS